MELEFELYFPQDNQNSEDAEKLVHLTSTALGQLLQLSPAAFWGVVAKSNSLAPSLESYLQHARRPHEFAEHQESPSLQRQTLARNVFLVMHRLAQTDQCQSRVEQKGILRKCRFFGVANCMDLAVLYVPGNPELVQKLFQQIVDLLPEVFEELREALPRILKSMTEVRLTCEAAAMKLLNSPDSSALQGLSDGLAYLRDCCSSLSALMQASQPTSHILLEMKNQLLPALLDLHSSLLVKVIKAWAACRSTPDVQAVCLKVQSAAFWLGEEIVNLFSTLLIQSCLTADSSPTSHQSERAKLSQNGHHSLDRKRKGQDLLQSLQLSVSHIPDPASSKSLPRLANTSNSLDKQILDAAQQGIIHLDQQQEAAVFQLLGSNLGASSLQNGSGAASSRQTSRNARNTAAIKQVKEVLPDYGDGFLSACLEALDHNPELVIQHILEGSLPEFLKKMDPMMSMPETQTVEPRLSAPGTSDRGAQPSSSGTQADRSSLPARDSQAGSSGLRWKELEDVERATAGLKIHEGPILSAARPAVASHKGTAKALLATEQDKAIAKLHAQAAQWEEYEDEYDDSYDDLAGYDADPNADPLGDETETDRGGTASNQNPPHQQGNRIHTTPKGGRGKPLWVLDGRIYNHRKEGATPVPNQEAAEELIRTSQDEIHGLGQGGNKSQHLPRMAGEDDSSGQAGASGSGRGRGRGRGGRGGPSDMHRARGFKDVNKAAVGNHHRKDRALRKMGGPAQS